MSIPFVKAQGLGNDVVIVDEAHLPSGFELNSENCAALCDRHFGIGCDQLLLVKQLPENEHDGARFLMRIFNNDGGEVEQCGNGARCAAVYIRQRMGFCESPIRVRTMRATIELVICDDGSVRVDMGVPRRSLPLRSGGERSETFRLVGSARRRSEKAASSRERAEQGLDVLDIIDGDLIDMGNPHGVHFVRPGVDLAACARVYGLAVERTVAESGLNASFAAVVDPHVVVLRVHERSVGQTISCGSGACATAVAGIARGLLRSPVRVVFPLARGGFLDIEWSGDGKSVFMTGEAQLIFDGVFPVPKPRREATFAGAASVVSSGRLAEAETEVEIERPEFATSSSALSRSRSAAEL
eukprot:a511691_28.p1 GENE.a511691_28~~a511691_28.p1  ORF type:complete len:363 (-),score=87.96 a511691_28:14-1081(-)